uniref:Gustatory receptor n=1 Tax=Anopheles atroparvus TaxID=41427 RepID=A0AAG5D4G6_ANOAO
MIHLVEDADRVLHMFSGEITHSKLHFVTVVLIAGTIFFNCMLVLIDVFVARATLKVPYDQPASAGFVFLYYYILRFIHLLSVTVFIAGLYGFRERLRSLNKQLRTMLLQTLENEPITEMADNIQGFLMIYSQLCDGLHLFCTIFVWQPMFLCATLTVTAVFAIFAICNMLANAVPILKALAIVYSAATMFF